MIAKVKNITSTMRENNNDGNSEITDMANSRSIGDDGQLHSYGS